MDDLKESIKGNVIDVDQKKNRNLIDKKITQDIRNAPLVAFSELDNSPHGNHEMQNLQFFSSTEDVKQNFLKFISVSGSFIYTKCGELWVIIILISLSLVVGGVHMTLLKKNFGKTNGVINFNMWWILFLKNLACFLCFSIYRIVEFSLAKNKVNNDDAGDEHVNDDEQNNAGEITMINNDNLVKENGPILQASNNAITIEEEETENVPILFNPQLYSTALLYCIPGVVLLLLNDFLHFKALSYVDLSTFALLGDTCLLFVVVFRGLVLKTCPGWIQLTLILIAISGIVMFRLGKSPDTLSANVSALGTVICLIRGATKGMDQVYWDWFFKTKNTLSFTELGIPLMATATIGSFIVLAVDTGLEPQLILRGFNWMLGVYIVTSLWISVICYFLIYKTNSLVKELLSQFALISTALIDMLVFKVEITAVMWAAIMIVITALSCYALIEYYEIPNDYSFFTQNCPPKRNENSNAGLIVSQSSK